jgi:hypothetical protein
MLRSAQERNVSSTMWSCRYPLSCTVLPSHVFNGTDDRCFWLDSFVDDPWLLLHETQLFAACDIFQGLCRGTISSTLALLHEICCSGDLLADSKRLPQLVACDMEAAARAAYAEGTSFNLVSHGATVCRLQSFPSAVQAHLPICAGPLARHLQQQ